MLEPFLGGTLEKHPSPEEFNKVVGGVVRRALRREVERLETQIEQRLSKQKSKSLLGESDFGQTCVLPYTVEKVRVATFDVHDCGCAAAR